MKRKWKIALIVLAIAVIACLWYMWPRSFEELAGDGDISFISTIVIDYSNPLSVNTWGVDGDENSRDMINGMKEILRSCKYRRSLRNLFPFPDAYNAPGKGGTVSANVDITLKDGSFFWAAYKGKMATLYFDNKIVVTQALDNTISQKLFDYAQEFGQRIEKKR